MANYGNVEYVCEGSKRDIRNLYVSLKSIQMSDCRDTITNYYYLHEKRDVLKIEMWCAWDEPSEFRRNLLSQFPSIKLYYEVEFFEDDVWRTNDVSGKYFPYRYFIDYEDSDSYFKTLDEAAQFVSQKFGVKVHNVNDIESVIDDYMEEHGESYYSFHECQVESKMKSTR